MADLEEGPWGSAPIFILVKKKIVEGRKAGRESDKKKKRFPLPPLAQGLDPPLNI